MKCERYSGSDGGGTCGHDAKQKIEDVPLCFDHARQRPLQIVLDETAKMRRHVHFRQIDDRGGQCGGKNLARKEDGEPGEWGPCERNTIFDVEHTEYCKYHAEKKLYYEVMFGKLRGVITLEDLHYADDGENDE